jgi:hypothetical protein
MAEMSRDYVIRKRGYFYRPEAQGYCADVRDAGRWTYEDAIAYQKGVDGVTVHHLREFPTPVVADSTPYPPMCRAARDGDCFWKHCPQLIERRNHCPIDALYHTYCDEEGFRSRQWEEAYAALVKGRSNPDA